MTALPTSLSKTTSISGEDRPLTSVAMVSDSLQLRFECSLLCISVTMQDAGGDEACGLPQISTGSWGKVVEVNESERRASFLLGSPPNRAG